MLTKRSAFGKILILAPALLLTIVPMLRVAHRHGDDAWSVAAPHSSHHACSGTVCGQNAVSAAPASVDTYPVGGNASDPNHSTDTCATCQSLLQLSTFEICAPSSHFYALINPELRKPQPEQVTVAFRHGCAILLRAPPVPV